MAEAGDDGDKTMIMAPSVKSSALNPAPKARLVCQDESAIEGPEGREITLTSQELTVGRGEEAGITVKGEGVSRVHARLFPGQGAWGVEDLGSTNGVKVNGEKIAGQKWLKAGDEVLIGRVRYAYEVSSDEKPAARPAKEVDLTGAGEKTVIMKPGARPIARPAEGATAESKSPPSAAARPRAAAQPAQKSGGAGIWLLIIGIIVIAVAAVAAFL